MKESKKVISILHELNSLLKNSYWDSNLSLFIKTVSKQLNKIERVRAEFIIAYWWMINNPYFLSNPKEKKCSLLEAFNSKIIQPKILENFQRDIMVLRIIEFFLKKYFDIKCLKFETLADNEVMYLDLLSDLVNFEENKWEWLSKYSFLYLVWEDKPSKKKRERKSYAKTHNDSTINSIKQIGLFAFSKSNCIEDDLRFFFIALPHPKDSNRNCAELENMTDQVMKVIAELIKIKVSKQKSYLESNIFSWTEIQKEGIKRKLRNQLVDDITQNIDISDLSLIKLNDLIDYENNIYKVERIWKSKRTPFLIKLNIL